MLNPYECDETFHENSVIINAFNILAILYEIFSHQYPISYSHTRT